ncbi:MAG TPA: restriction endonuclease [Methylophaga sp.]|nr:restriction endonuclease [Methylophaga sp.]
MARKRQSTIEDLVELTAMMPWWIGAILAVVSYLYFSNYVAQPVAPIVAGKPMDFTAPLFRGLATVLQYILPCVFCIGAITSIFERKKRSSLFNSASSNSGKKVLDDISWQDFELLVGEYFRHKGYSVEECGGNGPDGGVDIILRKDGETTLVQCKQWKALKVGVKIVREIYGVMAAEGAEHGYVVTSGRFTSNAIKFAEGREIVLIDGNGLNRLIQKSQTQRKPINPIAKEQSVIEPNVELPSCPNCGSQMVKRTARQGQNAGKQFWGCSGFPKCRGIRSIAPEPPSL